MPLAESRGGASGGVWGNAPTVPRQIYSKKTANKGAGSEASLPVTLRVRRRASQLALSWRCALSRQMGATDQHREKLLLSVLVFLLRGKSLMRIPLLPLPLTKKRPPARLQTVLQKTGLLRVLHGEGRDDAAFVGGDHVVVGFLGSQRGVQRLQPVGIKVSGANRDDVGV